VLLEPRAGSLEADTKLSLSAGTLSGSQNSSGELAHELKDANETQEIFGAVQTATAFINTLG
jgi:hypothetical protein